MLESSKNLLRTAVDQEIWAEYRAPRESGHLTRSTFLNNPDVWHAAAGRVAARIREEIHQAVGEFTLKMRFEAIDKNVNRRLELNDIVAAEGVHRDRRHRRHRSSE